MIGEIFDKPIILVVSLLDVYKRQDVHLELPADGRAWKFLAYPEKLPAGSAVELDYRSADRDILL